MFCSKCGKEIPENSTFCPYCGNEIRANSNRMANNEHGGQAGNRYDGYHYERPVRSSATQNKLGGWFKFITNVQLLFGPIVWFVDGIMLLTGAQYRAGEEFVADQVYSMFPGLHFLDCAYGLACFALAICGFMVRSLLRKKDTESIKHYIIFTLLNLGSTLIYLAVASLIIGEYSSNSEFVTQFAGTIVFFIINVKYLKSHKKYFDANHDSIRRNMIIGEIITAALTVVCFFSLLV